GKDHAPLAARVRRIFDERIARDLRGGRLDAVSEEPVHLSRAAHRTVLRLRDGGDQRGGVGVVVAAHIRSGGTSSRNLVARGGLVPCRRRRSSVIRASCAWLGPEDRRRLARL